MSGEKMDCTLKFMKEYNLRSMNNRATITQGWGFGFVLVFFQCWWKNEAISGMCVAVVGSAFVAGCCGHPQLMILKG